MPYGEEQQARDFLEEQLKDTRHRIARLEHVRHTCNDCSEAAGLDAMLRSVEAERRVIEDLLACRKNGAVTAGLCAQIMVRLDRLRTRAADAAARWRRGKHTPSAYWEVVQTRTVLEQLLRRWNAWRAGRPYYPSVANGAAPSAASHAPPPHLNLRGNPWSVPPQLASNGLASPPHDDAESALNRNSALRDKMLAVLQRAGIKPDHVDIVFASEQVAVVTALAHSDAERRVIINTVIGSDEIDLVLADVRIIDPGRCPVCKRQQTSNGTTPNGPRPVG